MKKLLIIISMAITLSFVYACNLNSDTSKVGKTVKVNLTCPLDGTASGAKSLIGDTRILSVKVVAEYSDGDGLPIFNSILLNQGLNSWTGSMNITVDESTSVKFKAQGWSELEGAGNLLYYGETEVELSPSTESLSISIGTVLLYMDWSIVWSKVVTEEEFSWTAIASSATGEKLAAVGYDVTNSIDELYTSTDFGIIWTKRTMTGSQDWIDITSSGDGTKLVAVTVSGAIRISTDSGSTWSSTMIDGVTGWDAITSSSDGSKLAAVGYCFYYEGATPHTKGYIYTSVDSGATWLKKNKLADEDKKWSAITISDDGTKLAAAGFYTYSDLSVGYICISTDAGATWTGQTIEGVSGFNAIASSADGTRLAAAADDGYIYTSTDSGATWVQKTGGPTKSWTSIASSADGTKLAALDESVDGNSGGYPYISADGGETWVEQDSSFVAKWSDIACSDDGTQLIAICTEGVIAKNCLTEPLSGEM